jgi:hypothetical protein
VAVDDILAPFYWKFGNGFKLGQENLKDLDAVLEGDHERIPIGVDCAREHNFLVRFAQVQILAAEHKLIFLYAPKGNDSWSRQQTVLLSGRQGDVAEFLAVAAAFNQVEVNLGTAGLEVDILAFPPVEVVFGCSDNHLLVVGADLHLLDPVVGI